MANVAPEVFATESADTFVEAGHGGAPTHSEPELFGLAPFQIVSVAMFVLLLLSGAACGSPDTPEPPAYDYGLPATFPAPIEPADNPTTPEKVSPRSKASP